MNWDMYVACAEPISCSVVNFMSSSLIDDVLDFAQGRVTWILASAPTGSITYIYTLRVCKVKSQTCVCMHDTLKSWLVHTCCKTPLWCDSGEVCTYFQPPSCRSRLDFWSPWLRRSTSKCTPNFHICNRISPMPPTHKHDCNCSRPSLVAGHYHLKHDWFLSTANISSLRIGNWCINSQRIGLINLNFFSYHLFLFD